MKDTEKYDYFCENYKNLTEENRDKLLIVGEKLLEIKRVVFDTDNFETVEKETVYGTYN